jgi:hypothetical protein
MQTEASFANFTLFPTAQQNYSLESISDLVDNSSITPVTLAIKEKIYV